MPFKSHPNVNNSNYEIKLFYIFSTFINSLKMSLSKVVIILRERLTTNKSLFHLLHQAKPGHLLEFFGHHSPLKEDS